MPGPRKRHHPRKTRSSSAVPVLPVITEPGPTSQREASHLWTAFGHELGRFPQARAQACLHAANRVAHCQSLPEVFEVQSKFFQDALHEYLDEAGRLTEVWTQACFRTLTSLQAR